MFIYKYNQIKESLKEQKGREEERTREKKARKEGKKQEHKKDGQGRNTSSCKWDLSSQGDTDLLPSLCLRLPPSSDSCSPFSLSLTLSLFPFPQPFPSPGVAVLSSFNYGYHIGVLNNPKQVITNCTELGSSLDDQYNLPPCFKIDDGFFHYDFKKKKQKEKKRKNLFTCPLCDLLFHSFVGNHCWNVCNRRTFWRVDCWLHGWLLWSEYHLVLQQPSLYFGTIPFWFTLQILFPKKYKPKPSQAKPLKKKKNNLIGLSPARILGFRSDACCRKGDCGNCFRSGHCGSSYVPWRNQSRRIQGCYWRFDTTFCYHGFVFFLSFLWNTFCFFPLATKVDFFFFLFFLFSFFSFFLIGISVSQLVGLELSRVPGWRWLVGLTFFLSLFQTLLLPLATQTPRVWFLIFFFKKINWTSIHYPHPTIVANNEREIRWGKEGHRKTQKLKRERRDPSRVWLHRRGTGKGRELVPFNQRTAPRFLPSKAPCHCLVSPNHPAALWDQCRFLLLHHHLWEEQSRWGRDLDCFCGHP